MKECVWVTLPTTKHNLLPQELKDWLEEQVSPITAPPPCDNYGADWRLKFVTAKRDKTTAKLDNTFEFYVFEFDDPRKAMLFKLAWG